MATLDSVLDSVVGKPESTKIPEGYVECSSRGCGKIIKAEEAHRSQGTYHLPYCNQQCESDSGWDD